MHVLSLFCVLLTVWVLLSAQFTPFLLGAGVLSSLLVTLLAIRKGIADKEGHPVHILSTALLYWPWLLYQIILANFDVVYCVLHPRLPISPRLVKIPYSTHTDLSTAIYANSITLTPGTVTVEVEKHQFLVHALTQSGAEDLRQGGMHRRVLKLERRP